MKKLLIILAILPTLLFGQENVSLPMNNGIIEYSKIVQVENKTKSEIYLLVKEWISDNHKSTKYVTDLDDKEAGSLIIKDLSFLSQKIGKKYYAVNVNQTIKVEIKEGRFKVTITPSTFSFKEMSSNFFTAGQFFDSEIDVNNFVVTSDTPKKEINDRNSFLKLMDENEKSILLSLEKYVTKSTKQDNW